MNDAFDSGSKSNVPKKKADDYFFTVGIMVINLKTFFNDYRVWYVT